MPLACRVTLEQTRGIHKNTMSVNFWIELVIMLACIFIGARFNGVGLGIWGGVGLFILSMGFGVVPTTPPVDVLLIILGVVTAAATMDAAGGIDFLVSVAEKIIRSNPKQITILAPLVTWLFTFLAGTGHVVYPLQPVIYEVAMSAGIRPERPMAVATIASQQSITASPVSAATAAVLACLGRIISLTLASRIFCSFVCHRRSAA